MKHMEKKIEERRNFEHLCNFKNENLPIFATKPNF